MNKTKKSGFLKIAGLMAAVMMLTTCVVAGTMAKYTSNGSTSVSLDVAKWDIKAGSSDITDLSSLSFTIYDTNGVGNVADAEVEEDMIAPGTWGYASIELTNAGNVDAKVTVALDGGASLPAGMTVKLLTEVPADSSAFGSATETKEVTLKKSGSADSTTATVVVAFVWTYEGNDSAHTSVGKTAGSLSLGTLTITADQID